MSFRQQGVPDGGQKNWRQVVLTLLLVEATIRPAISQADSTGARRVLDRTYRPPPLWGCESGLPPGAFHVVVATLAPEPTALVPWIWNLGLTGAEIWIYHRLDPDDPRLAAAATTLADFEPFPCNSTVHLERLQPNKGREAAVYMAHIVRHYNELPEGLVLVHDHGPAARHSLCGPFFRRVRGYYAGIREQLKRASRGDLNDLAAQGSTVAGATLVGDESSSASGEGWGGSAGRRRGALGMPWRRAGRGRVIGRTVASTSTRQMLARFADMVVSLSSGCQENWLKGCCALLVCAEDGDPSVWHPSMGNTEVDASAAGGLSGASAGATAAAAAEGQLRLLLQEGGEGPSQEVVPEQVAAYGGGSARAAAGEWDGRLLTAEAAVEAAAEAARTPRARCPFRTSRCLANASAMGVPLRGGMARRPARWVYMHGAGGLYDTRYENLVVLYDETPEAAAAAAGLANAGFGPLSLLRYSGPGATETARLQTSSSRDLDYPEGAAQRTTQETFAQLGQILQAHDFAAKKAPGNFKSCCASLMLRPRHIRQWPRSMYEQILSYTLDARNTYHASLAISHHGWSMWSGADVGPEDLMRYFEVDLVLLNIRGCPGWRMVDPGAAGAVAAEAGAFGQG